MSGLKLNGRQEEAVRRTDGAVLILAGAGSGKTRVLVARTLEILEQNLARPFECLLLTFTNKAAEEMRHRLSAHIGEGAKQIWLSTFHRFGVRVLRRYAERVGYGANFNILAESDQERLIKQAMEALKIDPKSLSPTYVLEQISLLKDKALGPRQVKGHAAKEIEDIYTLYQKRMQEMNVMDFGDLLLLTFVLFQNHPDVLKSYADQFKYIMVDEYQDTNVVQYLMLRLLTQSHGNICCVGDEDQSIYAWRGAEISNILNFQKDFPKAAVIRLEENYRSTPSILEAAGKLIRHNKKRIGKELRVADGRKTIDAPVRILSCLDANDEAETVLRRLYELKKEGIAYKETAILVRAAFQTRAFEEKLIASRIPYQVLSGRKFYERQEIQDVIAYLRLLKHRQDDMAFIRIINMPKRGIGEKALLAIRKDAGENGTSFFESLKRMTFKPAQRKTVSEFVALFEKYEKDQDRPFYEMAHAFIEETGYIGYWRENKAEESEARLDNMEELFGVMQDGFNSLEEFLEYVSLVTDQDAEKGDDRVTLMTMHAAKGLEFDAVFIPGAEEGILPHQKSMDAGEDNVEEERRLMYVGMTRAKKELMITFAATRMVFGQFQNNLPSRFLAEIAGRMDMDLHPSPPKMPAYRGYAFSKKRPAKEGFKPTDMVRHERFGIGEIIDIEGDTLDIRFDEGIKKIKAGFVRPYKE